MCIRDSTQHSTHVQTHTHSHSLTHSLTYTHTHARTHAHARTCTHTHTHSLTHSLIHTHTHTLSPPSSLSHSLLLSHICIFLTGTGVLRCDCAGKGLTLVHSVLEGKFSERYADAQAAKQVSVSGMCVECTWHNLKIATLFLIAFVSRVPSFRFIIAC